MDRIGHEGFTFHNALVVNSPCLPSRATFLTGQYSHTTGAVSNVEGTIPSQFKLISDMFHAAGYETAFIGKYAHQGALKDHDWDYYLGFMGQADYNRPVLTEGVRGNYSEPTHPISNSGISNKTRNLRDLGRFCPTARRAIGPSWISLQHNTTWVDCPGQVM